jgi:hypothetical protein
MFMASAHRLPLLVVGNINGCLALRLSLMTSLERMLLRGRRKEHTKSHLQSMSATPNSSHTN